MINEPLPLLSLPRTPNPPGIYCRLDGDGDWVGGAVVGGVGIVRIVPMTLDGANAFVAQYHRHHAPVVSHRWSIGVGIDGPNWFALIGVAICGRPKARALPQYAMIEVNRLATTGVPNACSKLYAACARIAKQMGFDEIETSILESEPGTSLRAVGWEFRRTIKGRDWNCPSRGGRRIDQPMCGKRLR